MRVERSRRASGMADVAARAGVSHQTVSRVVNGSPNVATATRERVEQAIAELGYRPNTAARALATGATRTLGLVTANVNQFGPAQTMLGLERAARAAGYSLAIGVIDEASAAAMQEAVERLLAQSVDAVIALATYADVLEAVRGLQTSVPLVTVQAGPDASRPTVWVEQEAGASVATRHLLGHGHATVHHVAGPVASLEARRRAAGWRRELRRAGAAIPAPLRGDWTPASGYRAGTRLVTKIRDAADDASRPTAVFVANDQMALGLLKAVQEEGLTVPGDLSVVGFDDLPEAAYFHPALTTVRQDFAELGRRGVEVALVLLSGHAGDVTGRIEPHLIERDSVGPPPRRRS